MPIKILLSALGGLFYAFSFLFPSLFVLGWIAWLPFFFALKNSSYQQTYFLAFFGGVVAYASAMHWMANLSHIYFGFPKPFHYIFLLLFSVVGAQFFCAIFLTVKFLQKNTHLNLLFLFPICVSFFSFYNPLVFHVSVGSSQSFFLPAIQAIDLLGIESLSLLLAFFNVFIYLCLIKKIPKKKISFFIFFTIHIFWFSYGFISNKKWENNYLKWQTKKIAVLQPNRIPHLFNSVNLQDIYVPLELQLMEKIKNKEPILTVWPEGKTHFYQLRPPLRKIFQKKIQLLKTHLLFNDNHYFNEKVYNSVFWLDKQGDLKDIYHKRVLVPFGEYLPLQKYYNWFLKWAGFPFGRFYKGKESKTFYIDNLKVVPLICYETIDSIAAAEAIGKNGKGKMFVVVTNNGWYDSYRQTLGHSNVSNLRAVENRVPLLHVINNGYSSLTMPNGKVIFKTPYKKQGVWVIDVPYNKNYGGSFYAKHPYLLKILISLLMLGLVLYALLRRFKFLA